MIRSYFSYVPSGLSVRFLNLSSGNPDSFNWDFGFQEEIPGTPTGQAATSTEEEPIVTFPKAGVYSVTLTITKGVSPNIQTSTLVLPVGVTSLYEGIALPTLILDAILTRLPAALLPDIAGIDAFIKKWQLYLRTLIDPNIAVGDTFDQTKWPALVNDLVINLCLYDILTDKMAGAMGSSVASGSTSSSGGLKKVVQGPAEAEWYSPSESSQTAANIMKPGGLYDQVLNRVCILASRLRIPLEFCPKLTFKGVPPTIYKPPVEYTLSDRDPSRNNEYTDISINPRNIHD